MLSRLIDNSVVVLENIFRHIENGEDSVTAAERGGQEVQLAVLAATFTTAIVFFPVVFLYGVSRYLFIALALGVVLALAASYLVAMTVVPLFCARFLKTAHGHGGHQTKSVFGRFVTAFNRKYDQLLMHYDRAVDKALARPGMTILVIMGSFVVSLALYPLLGLAFFPRTDPGQFVINIKAPTGSRLEMTNQYVGRIENDIRDVIPSDDLQMIVSNIGLTPDLSSIYTSNSGQHTAFVQISLKSEHKLSTFTYMDRVRRKLASDLPEVSTYFQTGGLGGLRREPGHACTHRYSGHRKQSALCLRGCQSAGDKAALYAGRKRRTHSAGSRLSRPGIECSSRNGSASWTDRERRGEQRRNGADLKWNDRSQLLGRSAQWQQLFPHRAIWQSRDRFHDMEDFKQIPLHAPNNANPTMLENVADIKMINTPTEVDHYQLFRVIDVYVSPKGEDLGALGGKVDNIIKQTKLPPNVRIELRGSLVSMRQSFKSFGIGLLLAIVLVYLILMAQFASFIDPFIILLAIPSGITGVIVFLLMTHTTLNVMSLMGLVMMTGIVVSNSILIVDVTRNYRREGMPIREAVALACRVRLRPILMTSLATILGLIPNGDGAGSG